MKRLNTITEVAANSLLASLPFAARAWVSAVSHRVSSLRYSEPDVSLFYRRRSVPLAKCGAILHGRSRPEGRYPTISYPGQGSAPCFDSRPEPSHLSRA
jgi:hypothetical protein